jgi:hypothetical protein
MKMMRHQLFLLFGMTVCISYSANAQKIRPGLSKQEICINTVQFGDLTRGRYFPRDHSWSVQPNFGFLYKKQKTKNLNVRVGLNYYRKSTFHVMTIYQAGVSTATSVGAMGNVGFEITRPAKFGNSYLFVDFHQLVGQQVATVTGRNEYIFYSDKRPLYNTGISHGVGLSVKISQHVNINMESQARLYVRYSDRIVSQYNKPLRFTFNPISRLSINYHFNQLK